MTDLAIFISAFTHIIELGGRGGRGLRCNSLSNNNLTDFLLRK